MRNSSKSYLAKTRNWFIVIRGRVEPADDENEGIYEITTISFIE